MKYRTYIESLDEAGLADYAKRARTTPQYLRIHLLSVPPRKTPRVDLMRRLATAAQGQVTWSELLEHFYGSGPERQHQASMGHPRPEAVGE